MSQKLLEHKPECPYNLMQGLGNSKGSKVGDTDFQAVKFLNYDEKEESTCIVRITLLRQSKFMTYVAAPLLSLCTAFIFALFLFWY